MVLSKRSRKDLIHLALTVDELITIVSWHECLALDGYDIYEDDLKCIRKLNAATGNALVYEEGELEESDDKL